MARNIGQLFCFVVVVNSIRTTIKPIDVFQSIDYKALNKVFLTRRNEDAYAMERYRLRYGTTTLTRWNEAIYATDR